MNSESPPSGSGDPESTPRNAGVTNVNAPRTSGSTTAPINQMITYDLLTEVLGLESLTTDYSQDLGADAPPSTESRSPRKRTGGSVRDERTELSGFPPTLSESGRPRFKLIKERNDGRLKITSVINDDPVVVRVNPRRDRGMRTEMILERWQERENEGDDHDRQVGQEDITDDEGVKQAKKRAKTVKSTKGEIEEREVGQEGTWR